MTHDGWTLRNLHSHCEKEMLPTQRQHLATKFKPPRDGSYYTMAIHFSTKQRLHFRNKHAFKIGKKCMDELVFLNVYFYERNENRVQQPPRERNEDNEKIM